MTSLFTRNIKKMFSAQLAMLQKSQLMSLSDCKKQPKNEIVLNYAPGSSEREKVDLAIKKLKKDAMLIPIVIGEEELWPTSSSRSFVMPSNHQHVLAYFDHADQKTIKRAIENSLSARNNWESLPLMDRAEIFFKAGNLVATKYRAALNAATMLGQAKNYFQAEIDAACEMADFFRFNAHFALKLARDYEPISPVNVKNEYTLRGLDGFVASISPFNFTAIGANLCCAPALMGNVVIWKPSDTSLLANWITFQVLREAGLPPGVVNFVPSDGPVFGDVAFSHPSLAAVNFTGSLTTFRTIWKKVAGNIDHFDSFPRLLGECSGKNFHFVHTSADVDTVVASSIRAAFEYQGQKCSALARLYVPSSMWPEIREKMIGIARQIIVGQPDDTGAFMSAVIDKPAFQRISNYIDMIKASQTAKLVFGGTGDSSKGYFIHPTIVECSSTDEPFFRDDIFGPILCVYPYKDESWLEVLHSVKCHTKFALTGAFFGQDEEFVRVARRVLRDTCGNLYVNDKCTGAVVGQQPFGGAGLSGTNDKAGGPHYLLRFASPLTTKTSLVPQRDWRYRSMD